MPLLVNIQPLHRAEAELAGTLPVEELDLGINDPVLRPHATLAYDLVVERLDDAVLARGELRLALDCQCVRCLRAFTEELCLPDWACHLPLSGDDAVPVLNDSVDLTPHIREDILLAIPQHPVCDSGCDGLKSPSQGGPEPAGSRETNPSSAAWAKLDKLKLKN
jgi:uncharacterized metal-binding protein YceD (DUF177 family)